MTAALLSAPVVADLFDAFERGPGGEVTFGWVAGRVLLAFAAMNALLLLSALVVWAERRVSAWLQDRLGPNRVGPEGLLQPIADLGKFVFKEDMIPGHVNRVIYVLAPVISLIPALVTFAVVPYAGAYADGTWTSYQIADLNIGILYVLSITSLGVYGITLGGWSSNSKYSLLGGVRSSAQMISYELSLGLAVVAVVLMAGSLSLGRIVGYQAETSWLLFQQPLAFFIFLVASYAETNRLPFDLPEAEQEIVAGYHTEYSAMKFAFFFLAEYANLIVASCLVVTLFCGGWTLFGLERLGWLVALLVFTAKVFFFIFVFLWVRWTLPRFRYDQLMSLGWVWFIPLGLLNVMLTGAALALQHHLAATTGSRQGWVDVALAALAVLLGLGAGLLGALRSPPAAAAPGGEGSRP